jgi:hypothetical protein
MIPRTRAWIVALLLATAFCFSLGWFMGHRAVNGGARDSKRDSPVEETRRWVEHFDRMAVDRVRHELGAPTEESSWKSGGVSRPLLIYQFTPNTKLQLFTSDREVLAALLTVKTK